MIAAYSDSNDRFLIRGGAWFGMTPEEVIAFEESNGVFYTESSEGILYDSWTDYQLYYDQNIGQYGELPIMRFEYDFDRQYQRMYQFEYVFKEAGAFDYLSRDLTNTFGSPISSDAYSTEKYSSFGCDSHTSYSQWTVPDGDLLVVIDLWDNEYETCFLVYQSVDPRQAAEEAPAPTVGSEPSAIESSGGNEAPENYQDLFGQIEGDVFENPYLGIGCSLPGWSYYSEEDILEYNQIVKENLSEQMNALIEKSGNIVIMFAESGTGLMNVNIQAQNIRQYAELYRVLGIESILGSQLDSFKALYESEGMQDVRVSQDGISIGEQSLACLNMSYTMGSTPVYAKEACYIKDDYMVIVTATSFFMDKTAEVFTHLYML